MMERLRLLYFLRLHTLTHMRIKVCGWWSMAELSRLIPDVSTDSVGWN